MSGSAGISWSLWPHLYPEKRHTLSASYVYCLVSFLFVCLSSRCIPRTVKTDSTFVNRIQHFVNYREIQHI